MTGARLGAGHQTGGGQSFGTKSLCANFARSQFFCGGIAGKQHGIGVRAPGVNAQHICFAHNSGLIILVC